MGKKGGSWFSAIKGVFTSKHNSNSTPSSPSLSVSRLSNNNITTNNNQQQQGHGEKKSRKATTRLKHGLFPRLLHFKEPSSIEKILEEVDQHHLYFPHPAVTTTTQPLSPSITTTQPQPSSSSVIPPLSPSSITTTKPQHPPITTTTQPQTSSSSSSGIPPLSPPITTTQPQPSPSSVSPPITTTQPQPSPSSVSPSITTTQPQPSSSSSSSSLVIPPLPPSPPRVVHSPPRAASSPPPQTTFTPSPIQTITHTPKPQPQPQPTLQQQHLSATTIQSAYRRYKSRRNSRGGLTDRLARLQGVVKGQHVKRQTVNAMKQMQLLVRVQTQIHSRRIQMLDNQPQLKPPSTTNTNLSEMSDWDDSVITKEEREARIKKKVEAITNRERAMSYAYSHQRKATPKSGHEKDIRTSGYPSYPWWWNSLERQLSPSQPPLKNHQLPTTPSRLTPDRKSKLDTPTSPMSSRSTAPSRIRQPTTPSRTPVNPNRIMMLKYPKARAGGSSSYPVRDDDSLMSCPPFTVPNYMSPTVSAKAKARPSSNPRDRMSTPTTPGSVSSSVSKRRFSFPFTPNSNKWNKDKSPRSVGDFSVDSANSMPASHGRKPFNRFV